MKFSTKGRFAVRALVDIGIHAAEHPVTVKEISERQGISTFYLEQLFSRMRKAGIIRGLRGPSGGYELAREPATITVLEAVEAAEGPVALADCNDDDDIHQACPRRQNCVTSVLWVELAEQLRELLAQVTLAELLERHNRLEASSRGS